MKAWAKADAELPQVVAAKAWMADHAGVAEVQIAVRCPAGVCIQ